MENYLTEVAAHEATALDAKLSTYAEIVRSTGQVLGRLLQEKMRTWSVSLGPICSQNRSSSGSAVGNAGGGSKTQRVAPSPHRRRRGPGTDIRARLSIIRSDWYLLPKLSRPAWTDPYDERIGRILMCPYWCPCCATTIPRGSCRDVSLENIRRQACRPTGEYRIVSAGTFVYHRGIVCLAESIFSLAEWHDLPALADLGRTIAGKRAWLLPDYRTGRQVVYLRGVPTAGWSLAAVIPEEEALAPSTRLIARCTC